MEGEEESPSSPKLYSDVIYSWLNNALDYGLTEKEFWEMTFAELDRAIASKVRVEEIKAKEKASYDYILADLIGRSISRIHSSANKMPDINEAYPSLFDSEDIQKKKQERQDELSALRFKQFANSYNKKFNKEVSKE